jgi:hypothetical protein
MRNFSKSEEAVDTTPHSIGAPEFDPTFLAVVLQQLSNLDAVAKPALSNDFFF